MPQYQTPAPLAHASNIRERGEVPAGNGPPVPTNKELEAIRREHYGDKAGTVHIDADLTTHRTELVFVDAAGTVTARRAYRPKGGK